MAFATLVHALKHFLLLENLFSEKEAEEIKFFHCFKIFIAFFLQIYPSTTIISVELWLVKGMIIKCHHVMVAFTRNSKKLQKASDTIFKG